jgi:O-antigen/teichoic acid export membrane protein
LQSLGVTKFGIWGGASSLAWFSGLVDIGLGTALVTLIARAKAAGNDEEARMHLTGALSFGSAIAVGMLGIAAIVFLAFGAKLQYEPYLIAVAGLALNVPLNSANNAWMALQKGHVSGLWELVQTLLTLGGLIAVSFSTTDVCVFVAVVYGAMLAANGGSLAHLLIAHPDLRPLKRSPFSEVRQVLREGFLLFALNLVGGLSFLFDNVLTLQLLGPEASAQMTIALRVCMTGLGFLLVVSQPLWPAFADAAAKLDKHWIRRSLFRGIGLLTGISGAGSLILLIFGQRLLQIWLHSSLGIGQTLLWAISGWVVAQALIRIPHLFLNGVSVVRFQLIVTALASALAILFKVLLARSSGVSAILWCTTLTIVVIELPAFLWRCLHWYANVQKCAITNPLTDSDIPRVV